MNLSTNLRRRIALYGSAAVIGALALTVVFRKKERLEGPLHTYEEIDRSRDDEFSRMLSSYVKIDTSDPPGRTVEAAAFLANAFACEGIPYDIVGADPERPIFVARLKGRERGHALLLLHHMDVVPAGDPKLWRQPPFSGAMGDREDRPYLYGRGTLDMKGFGVAAFAAMAALRRSGIVPLRDIVYLGEPGEEQFSAAQGVGWVVTHRPDLLEGVTDVLNEGGVNEAVVSKIQRFGIEVMQKATVSVMVDGPSAEPLEKFRAFLQERNKELPYRIVPSVDAYLRFIASSRNDIWGRLFYEPKTVLTSENFRLYSPVIYQDFLKDMIYAFPAEKGPEGSMIRAVWTLLPGSPVSAAKAQLEAWARERHLASRLQFMTEDSVETPASGFFWDALTRVLDDDSAKAAAGPWVLTTFYTNSSYLRAHGFRAYGFSPFHINILDAGKVHNANERVDIVSFVEGVRRMERIVREFATAPRPTEDGTR